MILWNSVPNFVYEFPPASSRKNIKDDAECEFRLTPPLRHRCDVSRHRFRFEITAGNCDTGDVIGARTLPRWTQLVPALIGRA